MTKDALLEIGSEELPASFIQPGMQQLKTLAEATLKGSGLTFASIETFGTPRRLAVLIHGLSESSADQKKTMVGPPAQAAKDAQGQWTPAAFGFARKQGLKPSDLKIENDRLCAIVHIKGVATRQLLTDLFPQWISKLEFPKSMIWEPTHFHYPRPIRWICALYGSDIVSFNLSDVRSARWTLGLGPWSPKKILMQQAGKYALTLKNQCVLVDPAARQDMTRRFAEQAVKRVHGKVHMSPALLEQVTNLVEHPVAILGNFDPAYLDLPKEVLVTCLEHHQKYFPVEEASGHKLLPHFVGIRNGMSIHQEIVREGYERVLAARLADARFFYSQDRRTPLSAKVDALKGVMFQEKLGNLFDKKERVKKLLEALSSTMSSPTILEKAQHVADLCKVDLVTDMVREFPELQGTVARLYAKAAGEDAELAQALEEHYWPITLTGKLPPTEVAAWVALADKLDTLAGDFAVGLIPSGSADPYGLRRAAVGVLRILEDRKWPLHHDRLAEMALATYPDAVRSLRPDAAKELQSFFRQRLTGLLQERGYRADEIDAVLEIPVTGTTYNIFERLEALHAFRKMTEFESLAGAFKRAGNIVRQAKKEKLIDWDGTIPPQEPLMKEEAEHILWQAIQDAGQRAQQASGYNSILKEMVPLRVPLDNFFDKVMVMAEDQELRTNRLRLLTQLTTLFRKVADFSKLQNA